MPPAVGALTGRRRRLAAAVVAMAIAGAGARESIAAPRAAAMAAVAAVAAVADRPEDPQAGTTGQVRFVTNKRVYLDRGAADGLLRRQTVELYRGGAKQASCRIELVAEHAAICRGAGGQIGDTFPLPKRSSSKAPAPAARALAPVVDDDTLSTRAQAIAASPHVKVDFTSNDAFRLPAGALVGAGVALFGEPGSPTQYAYEAIDVDLRHVPIGSTGLRFDGAFSALRRQTAIDPRFRPTATSMFYLWEAELSRREADARTVFAIGRLWPWHTPGLPMLDGAQLGRRNETGTIEAGAYGGFLPSALTLAPMPDGWAGGLYGAATQGGGGARAAPLAREEARIGVRRSPTVGIVQEVEALAQLWSASLALGAGGRLRRAPLVDSGPVVELAYGDVRFQPAPSVRASMQLRYLGVAPESQPLLRSELPSTLGGFHGAFDLSFSAYRWLGLGIVASANRDRDSDLDQGEAGLELRLPRLFGEVGGAAAGASAGAGWLRSRSAFVQAVARTPRLRIVGRVNGSVTQIAEPVSTPLTAEVGAALDVEASLAPWLRLVARSLFRTPIVLEGLVPPSTLYGIVSRLDLMATY